MKPAEWSKTEERSDDGISFGVSIAPPKANVTFPTKSYWQSFVKRGCLKCNKKHLRQFFFCVTEKDFAEVKKKASKRGENEYDKKRIVEILVF